MKYIALLLASASIAMAQTNEIVKIRVTGDRVSLRAQPNLEGELLDRAMRGDEMVFFEETNGWVAVQAPESLNFWVAAEFLEDSRVTPKKLNVRSGPSQNYNVVAVVERDDVLTVRGKFKEWLKIAPPLGSRVWISADYIELVNPPKPVTLMPEPEPVADLEPANSGEPEVVEEAEKTAPLMLVLDDTKPQGKKDRIPGVLRRANPGLYKLVLISGDMEEPICLVRGRESQLESMLNRSLLIEGPLYWVKDVDLPVIQPDVIHLDPIIAD
ncbi:SH3 domain-containing protein [Pontiellaceae bacterium B12219]|nr:SH3 domain-containing protein [Pontiellaceae bacterium B12219]